MNVEALYFKDNVQKFDHEASEENIGKNWVDNFIVVLGGCFVLWYGVGQKCSC